MDTIWDTLRQEFADLPNAAETTRVVLRLLMAVLLAGAIGWERERRESAAGLRTHMLVGLGAALFVTAGIQAGMNAEQVSRVLQGVIAGIGFLGAGAILKREEPGDVRGLTTAASIWTTAAIGVSVGMGRHVSAVIATAIVLAILAVLLRLERRR